MRAAKRSQARRTSTEERFFNPPSQLGSRSSPLRCTRGVGLLARDDPVSDPSDGDLPYQYVREHLLDTMSERRVERVVSSEVVAGC